MKPQSLSGTARKNRVERREVPNRRDVFRRCCQIRRFKIRMFKEVAAHFRREEYHEREDHQEDNDRHQVFAGVIRMERNAVKRYAVRTLVLLDLDAVRVVRSNFMQRNNVDEDQANQSQRQRDDMQREEAIQRDVRDRIIATNNLDQRLTNPGIAPNSEIITCAPQYDICPHGSR